MNERQAAGVFSALSDPSRLAILRLLVKAGPAGLPAGKIATGLDASPSRTSFHLASLAKAHLVSSRKEARSVVYAVRFDTLGGVVTWLIEDCCAGVDDLKMCCP
ncbi:MAG: metalloregulator ArsR/SmtB family transcription factor [Pseudomonadota bacterium]